jgi:osmotically inducible protein OsmC
MALSGELSKAGYTVEEINTEAIVSMEKGEAGFSITGIKLITKARVKDIEMETFAKFASGAKENCPVSRALTGVKVYLEAHLLK